MSADKLCFTTLRFMELTPDLLYEILQLRQAVFVVEQNCIYQDLDGKDREALHLTGRIDGELVAYARILAPGIQYPEFTAIGRVITAESWRGRGIGAALMKHTIAVARKHFPGIIKISAQQHLSAFYEELGFVSEGERYLEDGIPHIAMVLLDK